MRVGVKPLISMVAFFSVLMPYIGLAAIPFDVQPFALLLSLFALATSGSAIRIPSIAYTLFFAFMLGVLGLLLNSFDPNQVVSRDLRILIGYASAVALFLFAYNAFQTISPERLTRVTDVALFIIFFGFVLNIVGLTSIIQIFVNRAIFDETTFGLRGLTSFFPEQSRLANQFVYFLTVYYFLGALNTSRAFLVFVMAALSASGQFFVNLMVLLASVVIASLVFNVGARMNRRLLIMFAVVFFFLVSFLVAITFYSDLLVELGFPIRGIQAFNSMLDLNIGTLGADLGFIYKISGPLQAIAAMIVNPIEIQLGSAGYFATDRELLDVYTGIIHSFLGSDQVPLPEKSYSVLGSWVTDLRLYGLILAIALSVQMFYLTKKKVRSGRPHAMGFYFAIMFLFITRSNTTDPTFWCACAALVASVPERGRSWK